MSPKATIFAFMLETINFKTVDPEFILNFCRDVNNDNGTKIEYIFKFIDNTTAEDRLKYLTRSIHANFPSIFKLIMEFKKHNYQDADLKLIIDNQRSIYDIDKISSYYEDIFNSHKGIDFIYYTREQQIRIIKELSKTYGFEIFSDEMLREKDIILVNKGGIELRVNFDTKNIIYIRDGFGGVGENGYINLIHYNREYKIQKMLNPVIYKPNEFRVTIIGVIRHYDESYTHNVFFSKKYKVDTTLYNENVIQDDLLKIVRDKTRYILKYNVFEIGKNEVIYYYRANEMEIESTKYNKKLKITNLIKEAYYK